MVDEESVHGLGRARPMRIGKRACGTATGPGVPHPVDRPVLLNLPAAGIIPSPHLERMPPRYLPIGHATGAAKARVIRAAGGQPISCHPLLDRLVAIDRRDYIIARAVKNDRWHNAGVAPHRIKGRLPLRRWAWSTK